MAVSKNERRQCFPLLLSTLVFNYQINKRRLANGEQNRYKTSFQSRHFHPIQQRIAPNRPGEAYSALGYIGRLDFERHQIAGEVIYAIESDSSPTSQQDEEARIATLAYALKKFGNQEDAAEFMRCLNAICVDGDARYRQMAASHYYGEIAERGVRAVLKEMALLSMQLASLNPVTEEVECGSCAVYGLSGKSRPRTLFDLEVAYSGSLIEAASPNRIESTIR